MRVVHLASILIACKLNTVSGYVTVSVRLSVIFRQAAAPVSADRARGRCRRARKLRGRRRARRRSRRPRGSGRASRPQSLGPDFARARACLRSRSRPSGVGQPARRAAGHGERWVGLGIAFLIDTTGDMLHVAHVRYNNSKARAPRNSTSTQRGRAAQHTNSTRTPRSTDALTSTVTGNDAWVPRPRRHLSRPPSSVGAAREPA